MAPLIARPPFGPVFCTPGVSWAAATKVRFVGSLSMRSSLKFVATEAFCPNSSSTCPVTVTVSLTVLTMSLGLTVTLADGETRLVCLTVLNPVSWVVTSYSPAGRNGIM